MGDKRKKRSHAWEYFTPNDDNSNATCDMCGKILSTAKGSTTGLCRHLASIHGMRITPVLTRNENAEDPMCLISKLAALDGLPFSVIANSVSLRHLFIAALNHSVAASPNSVRDGVMKYYFQVKSRVTNELQKLKQKKNVFSVTLDEWTSGANRRYMNVNLHLSNRFWNLGLIRITGSFTADLCLKTLKDKLCEFGIDFDSDIFALVTDGASVMKKFGRISSKPQQLCMAHGIHLAVTDVLYDQPSTYMDIDEDIEESDESDDEEGESGFTDNNDNRPRLHPNVNGVIMKVRKIVRMFHKSPKKEETLLKYSPNKATLKLDTRTRWNSLLLMLERFLFLKEAVQKSLIDLQVIGLTIEEYETLDEIVTVLKPIQIAAEVLCRRSANLVTSDTALQFMMQKLSNNESDLGKRMYAAMKTRIKERRSSLSEVLHFIHYGSDDQLPAHRMGYFTKLARSELFTQIKLHFDNYDQVEEELSLDSTSSEGSQSLLLEVSMESELNLAINQAMGFKPQNQQVGASRDPHALVKKEMNLFQTGAPRGKILQSVYDKIVAVPPTSVEAERVFSSANNFCRKTRCRLGDSTLDALVFLKAFFLDEFYTDN